MNFALFCNITDIYSVTVRLLPAKEKRLHDLEERMKSEMVIEGEEIVEEYYRIREQLTKLRRVFVDTMNQPIYCLPFLQPGRLVKVTEEKKEWGWGVVVNFQKKAGPDDRGMGSGGHYIVDVLLRCAASDPSQKSFKPQPCPPGQGMRRVELKNQHLPA